MFFEDMKNIVQIFCVTGSLWAKPNRICWELSLSDTWEWCKYLLVNTGQVNSVNIDRILYEERRSYVDTFLWVNCLESSARLSRLRVVNDARQKRAIWSVITHDFLVFDIFEPSVIPCQESNRSEWISFGQTQRIRPPYFECRLDPGALGYRCDRDRWPEA